MSAASRVRPAYVVNALIAASSSVLLSIWLVQASRTPSPQRALPCFQCACAAAVCVHAMLPTISSTSHTIGALCLHPIALHCIPLLCRPAAAAAAGPEPGLTRDPTSGWLQHAGLTLQLVDTAGWKRPNAAAPTQSPTAAPLKGSPAAAAAGSRDSSRDSDLNSGSMKAGAKGGVPTPKVLADASLLQARRALSAVHVAVLLLDAPRLLTIGQVRCCAAHCI